MENINFRMRDFRKLKELRVDKKVLNTEAQLFLLPLSNKWFTNYKLLKRFYNIMGKYFSNKLYTINELVNLKEKIDVDKIDELILPESLFSIDGVVCGYMMPYIESINLKTIMVDKNIDIHIKVEYLKKIGLLLEKMQTIRKYTNVKDMYLNDIHESNFIIDKKTKKLYLVDMDSVKIGTNVPSIAKYLSPFSKINEVSKYQRYPKEDGSFIIPDQNTEIYCYIIMIFNLFFGTNVGNLSMGEFYNYLEYLAKIGVDSEFLKKVSYIYSGHDNVNPYNYLDDFTKFYGQTSQKVYELVRR